MNAARRKMLNKIFEALEASKADLETCAGEERASFDNMPEGLQKGEKGQAVAAAADSLDNAVSSLEDVLNSIQEANQ